MGSKQTTIKVFCLGEDAKQGMFDQPDGALFVQATGTPGREAWWPMRKVNSRLFLTIDAKCRTRDRALAAVRAKLGEL